MALMFNTKPVATIKAKKTGTTDFISMGGCTTGSISPAAAAAQMNKILTVIGQSVTADQSITRTQTEEVVDDE